MTVWVVLAGVIALAVVLRLPTRFLAGLIAAWWAVVMLAHLVLPADAALLAGTGGWRGWLVLGALALIGFGYRVGLTALRVRSRPETVVKPSLFSETELDRYARHIVLREIGGPGQKRLKQAKVLVIGAGGLGSPLLLYLAAAGVGTIGVVDDDTVSNSNLQRQVIHTDARIGMPKVFSAEQAMLALNPHIAVRPYQRRLTEADARALFAEYDIILDGTDNFATRYMVNAAAVVAGKPLIAAAIAQWEGQISVYDPARGAPCFACVFPEPPADGLAPSCAVAGVMGALPGVVGAMMAVEAIKLIAGAGEPLRGRMLIYDALYAENRAIALKRRDDCAVCGRPHALDRQGAAD